MADGRGQVFNVSNLEVKLNNDDAGQRISILPNLKAGVGFGLYFDSDNGWWGLTYGI